MFELDKLESAPNTWHDSELVPKAVWYTLPHVLPEGATLLPSIVVLLLSLPAHSCVYDCQAIDE